MVNYVHKSCTELHKQSRNDKTPIIIVNQRYEFVEKGNLNRLCHFCAKISTTARQFVTKYKERACLPKFKMVSFLEFGL